MNRKLVYTLGVLLWIGALLTVVGCSTVHQQAVEAHEPANYVRPFRLSSGEYLVDDAFRDRYNALIAVYGHKKLENGAPVFLPPLEKDAGVRANGFGHWIMTREAMENMALLSDMKRRGSAP